MSLHSNLAFRNLQCTICIFKTSKMTQIHLFVMNFNRSAVLVDSGFGLGRSLADRRHAAPKDRKYQRVNNQAASVGGKLFEFYKDNYRYEGDNEPEPYDMYDGAYFDLENMIGDPSLIGRFNEYDIIEENFEVREEK